jgi:polysaccharide biosynthesis PFTS motif protein
MNIDYLTNFQEITIYDYVIISDDIIFLEELKTKKNTLFLLYPNYSFPYLKKLSKNITIKNFPLSILNNNFDYRFKSHKEAVIFASKCKKFSRIFNWFSSKIVDLLIDKERGELIKKNFISNLAQKYFFYKSLEQKIEEKKVNLSFYLKDKEMLLFHKYLKKIDKKKVLKKTQFSKNINHKQILFYLKRFTQIFFYPLYAIVNSNKNIFKKFNFNKIDNFIRLYNASFGLAEYPGQSEEWIIDKKNFKKNNTVFVLEDKLSENKIKILRKKKLKYLNANIFKPIHYLNLKSLVITLLKYQPIFTLYSFIYLFSDIINKRLIFNFLYNCLIWDNFSSNVKKKKYITQNDMGLSHYVRNYFLNKNETKIFLYKHSFSENVFFKNINSYSHSVFAYNRHDFEFQMSWLGVKMSKSNKSNSPNIIVSGPVWGSDYFKRRENKEIKKTIVAFTSTLSQHGVNAINEHYFFFKFLSEILNNYKACRIVLKTKTEIQDYFVIPKLSNILKSMLKTKRLKIIKKNVMPRILIDQSELIISMPFTTPCFEALFLKKKCFFANISGNYKQSILKRITKKFVALNHNESIKFFKFYMSNNLIVKKTILKNAKIIFRGSLKYDPINFIKEMIYKKDNFSGNLKSS